MIHTIHSPAPDKSLGQHFLRDGNIIRKIVDAIHPQKNESILEIGPGPGALTIPLLSAGANVVAVEKDARFKSMLEGLAESRGGNLNVYLEDAMKVNWSDLVPAGSQVVGNLPYNVGTHIVLNLLQSRVQPSQMVFMLQKEVIDRFVAKPSTPARGRISIWCELLSDTQVLFNVPRNAFNPPPKVISSVMRMRPLTEPRYDVDMNKLKFVLNTTFNQRRKMLRASLKKHIALEDMIAAGIDPAARPETLTTEEFCTLANLT